MVILSYLNFAMSVLGAQIEVYSLNYLVNFAPDADIHILFKQLL